MTTLFFGTQSVKMFSLAKNTTFKVNRFANATAAELGGEGRISRKIIDTCRATESVNAVVLTFGGTDCKFSYYKRLCAEESPPDPETMMIKCAAAYMEFVNSIRDAMNPKGVKIIVIGAEPNGSPPSKTFAQCVFYKMVADTAENRRKIEDSVETKHPDELRQTFNGTLKHLCSVHEMEYIDIDEFILEPDTTDRDQSVVKKKFCDIMDVSVNLNWDENLMLYRAKLRPICVFISAALNLKHDREAYLVDKSAWLTKRQKTK